MWAFPIIIPWMLHLATRTELLSFGTLLKRSLTWSSLKLMIRLVLVLFLVPSTILLLLVVVLMPNSIYMTSTLKSFFIVFFIFIFLLFFEQKKFKVFEKKFTWKIFNFLSLEKVFYVLIFSKNNEWIPIIIENDSDNTLRKYVYFSLFLFKTFFNCTKGDKISISVESHLMFGDRPKRDESLHRHVRRLPDELRFAIVERTGKHLPCSRHSCQPRRVSKDLDGQSIIVVIVI